VLGIVLPIGAATHVVTVATSNICVAVEIVVGIDVDVVVAPSAAPAPSATPESAHHDADSER
jgi:hypothetical protein